MVNTNKILSKKYKMNLIFLIFLFLNKKLIFINVIFDNCHLIDKKKLKFNIL